MSLNLTILLIKLLRKMRGELILPSKLDVLKLAYSMCRYDKAINYT